MGIVVRCTCAGKG